MTLFFFISLIYGNDQTKEERRLEILLLRAGLEDGGAVECGLGCWTGAKPSAAEGLLWLFHESICPIWEESPSHIHTELLCMILLPHQWDEKDLFPKQIHFCAVFLQSCQDSAEFRREKQSPKFILLNILRLSNLLWFLNGIFNWFVLIWGSWGHCFDKLWWRYRVLKSESDTNNFEDACSSKCSKDRKFGAA